MVVPEVNAAEAALIPDLKIIPVKALAHLFGHLTGHHLLDMLLVYKAFEKISIISRMNFEYS